MADRLLFSAFPIPYEWPWGGDTFTLALISNMNWTNQNGGVMLRGEFRAQDITGEPAQLCPGTVLNRTATVQDFYVEPTLRSIDAPNDALLSGVLFDHRNRYRATLFSSWAMPDTPIPMTWPDFTRYNHLRCKRIGISAMDTIRAWFDSISIIDPGDLAKLPTARGTAIMVDGTILVPSVLVTADSLPVAWSMSPNVTGQLLVDFDTLDPGVGFTVSSTNLGDNGLIAWEIRQPF